MVNLESLVTKEHLESRLDARFAEQKSYIDTRFSAQKAYMDTRFDVINNKMLFFAWTQAIVVAAVIVPLIERFAS